MQKQMEQQNYLQKQTIRWIDTDNVTLEFLEDNSFLWASERDGFRHLYWYDKEEEN